MVKKLITEKLVGVTPAIITPMTEDGEISFPLLEKQAKYLSENKINGILLSGSTGEGPFLRTPERNDIYKTIKNSISENIFICVACLQPSTTLVLDEIKTYRDNLPDFFVAVTPFYGGFSQYEIVEHYKLIAKESPVPILLYNIPKCTNNKISQESLLELAQVENIAGMKDSSGDFLYFNKCFYDDLPENFTLFQGEDYLEAAGYSIGAKATVNGIGNIFIEPYINLYNAYRNNNQSDIRKYQIEINKVLEIIQVPGAGVVGAVKAATSILGRGSKWTRMPFQAVNDAQMKRISEIIERLDISSIN